jgi:putative flippase GtrA
MAARLLLRGGGRPEEAERPRPNEQASAIVHRRLLKFALIGVLNTGITFLVFNLCTSWLHAPAATANVIGWTAGFVNSFVWNRSWTFHDRRDLPARIAFLRFAVVNAVALGVSEAVLIGLEALAGATGLTDTLGRALTLNVSEAASICAALCVNYALSARWAFGAARATPRA